MFHVRIPLKEYGRSERRLHVVGELGYAQQVRPEHAILNLDVNREPVGGHHPVAAPEVHGEAVVARELRRANATDKIEGARHGVTPTEEGLAREQVVAQRDVIVREVPLSWGKQLYIAAEGLEAGAPGIRAAVFAQEEEVLGYVIGRRQSVGVLGAEVLDRDESIIDPDLDVRAPDPGDFDLAPLDFGIDHAGRSGVRVLLGGQGVLLRGFFLGFRLCLAYFAAVMEPVAHGGAAWKAHQDRSQKKNANPSFHSSTSSFALRFVNTTWLLYSARTKKRRVR